MPEGVNEHHRCLQRLSKVQNRLRGRQLQVAHVLLKKRRAQRSRRRPTAVACLAELSLHRQVLSRTQVLTELRWLLAYYLSHPSQLQCSAHEYVCQAAPATAKCERDCCPFLHANADSLISGFLWAAEPEKGRKAFGSLLGGGKRAAKEAQKGGKQVGYLSALAAHF